MDISKEINLFALQMRSLPHTEEIMKVKKPVLRQLHCHGAQLTEKKFAMGRL